MSDARVSFLIERLVEHHVPGKNISELPEEVIAIARREAELLFEILDELRPPDIGVLATRQVERIAAHSRIRQLQDNIETLKSELEPLKSSPKFEHLESGLLWAVEVLSNKLDNLRVT